MPKAHLRFGAALALQLGLLAFIPAGQLWIRATGQTVLLKTAPVDPYSILSGYYMTLGYEIGDTRNLPGWDKLDWQEGAECWVLLAPDEGGAWKALSVHKQVPPVPAGQAVIRGRYRRWRGPDYGIETYYIPEKVRHEMADVFRNSRERPLVEVKIAKSGAAAIVRIHAGNRTFEY